MKLYRYEKRMNKPEGMGNSLIAINWMTNGFEPDMQVIIKVGVFASLHPQLFLLQQQNLISLPKTKWRNFTVFT